MEVSKGDPKGPEKRRSRPLGFISVATETEIEKLLDDVCDVLEERGVCGETMGIFMRRLLKDALRPTIEAFVARRINV